MAFLENLNFTVSAHSNQGRHACEKYDWNSFSYLFIKTVLRLFNLWQNNDVTCSSVHISNASL